MAGFFYGLDTLVSMCRLMNFKGVLPHGRLGNRIALAMNAVFTPIESEFSSAEEAQAYDQWLRDRISSSLADQRPNIPHDVVMAEMREMIEIKRAKNVSE